MPQMKVATLALVIVSKEFCNDAKLLAQVMIDLLLVGRSVG